MLHQVFMRCFRVISSISIPAQLVNCLHSFLVMVVVRNKCVMVSSAFFSQHQYLDTILIFILFRLSSMASLLFQTFHRKKFILKGIPFT
uniref:Putative ovule protein n=1 Tax=Solanum chacoense TaxID=4108 RepID=A0A0V0HPS3_SOLCH